MMATRKQLQDINVPAISSTGESGGLVIDMTDDGYMPAPEKFVAYEVGPELTYEVKPDYPRLACEGNFTGYVILQAFVDKYGAVRKAQAVKCNRPGMGFEEAAVKAALKCKYRPAIQNGNPIGVWVSYKVDFRLE